MTNNTYVGKELLYKAANTIRFQFEIGFKSMKFSTFLLYCCVHDFHFCKSVLNFTLLINEFIDKLES